MGVLMTPVVFSQVVTLECYYHDTVSVADTSIPSAINNKPGDREVFTGIIVSKVSPTSRVKIYFPYEVKVRGKDVLIYDNKGHSSFFNLDSTTQFTTREELQTWLRYCHFQPRVEQYELSNDTIYFKLTRDSLRFVVLPPGFTDTDDQIIDTFYIDNLDSLHIKIQDDPRTWAVYLDFAMLAGADKQRFDEFQILNDSLFASLQRDSVVHEFVDLHPYKDSIKQFYVSNDSVYLRIGTDYLHNIKLTNFDTDSQSLVNVGLDSIRITRGNQILIPENQYPDTFAIVSGILRLSVKDDRMPFYGVDLSPFNWIAAATTGTSQTIGNAGSPETVTWVGSGIVTTSISGNTITINAVEADSSITNEIQTLSTSLAATSLAKTVLSLSGGQFLVRGIGTSVVTVSGDTINISSTAAVADTQSLYIISPDSIGITRGNKIRLPQSRWIIAASSGTPQTIGDDTNPETVTIVGANGITSSISGNTVTLTAVQVVDSSLSNEGLLGVGAGGATSSTLLSNTSGQIPITVNVAGILAVSETPSANGGQITLTATEVQALSTASKITTLTGGTGVEFINGAGVTITQGGTSANATLTFSASVSDTSATNEAQTLTNAGTTTLTQTLSQINGVGGGSTQWLTTTGISLSHTTNVVTLSVVDQTISNEGLLGVGAGGATSSTLLSNTSGQIPITINVGGIISISETPSANGGQITLTATEIQALSTISKTTNLTGGTGVQFINGNGVTITQGGTSANATLTFAANDTSATNEAQTWSNSGTTSWTGQLSTISGIGGGSTQMVTTTGISLSHTANVVTWSVVDQTISNEGLLGVGAGGATSSTLLSNTSTSNPITINVAGILAISETPSANGGQITLTATEVQALNTVSKITTLTGGTGLQFINGPGVTITQGGTAANATLTFSATDTSVTNEAQTLTNAGTTTLTQTLNQINGVGGGSTFWQTTSGISLAHSTNTVTLSVNDKDSTNEIQLIDTFIIVGNVIYLGITRDGQNAKTVTLPTDVDNYVDSVQFNTTTRNLKVGRTGALPDLTVNIPAVLDYDFVERGRTPPDNIYDTIFTFRPVGINDSTPDAELDVLGTFHLSNQRGVIDTRFIMNWDTRNELSAHHTYHVDYIRSTLEDENDPGSTSLAGFIDYTLYNAYPTYGSGLAEFVFGAGIYEPLKLRNDTVRMVRAVIEKELRDKNYSPGSDKKLLTSYQGTNILWDSLTAGPGITISQLTVTAKDTSALNEIQNIRAYIVSGDTLGFILNKTEDTVSFYSDTSGLSAGGGGSGTPQTFTHTGSSFLLSTLSDLGGSIKIAPGTQIEVVPTISSIDGIATIRTNFNACPTCVGFFGANAGYVNDSIITDPLFFYAPDEGIPVLNVPTVNLTQTNPYVNPVALYIAPNNDERVYVSGTDASGFTAANFHHKVTSASTIAIPSGHTGPTTHYFLNDGFAFTLQRSGAETIDGATSVSFAATDKLVIISNDGSGKWFTNKVTASGGSSGDITYGTSTLSFITGTTMQTVAGSSSGTIPAGTYLVKVWIRESGVSGGLNFALGGSNITYNHGKWDYPVTCTSYASKPQPTLGTGTGLSTANCSSPPNALIGEFMITSTGSGVIYVQGSCQGVFDDLNVFSIWINLKKIL